MYKSGANFVPSQLPIGAFNDFNGVVNVIEQMALEGEGKGKETAVAGDLTDQLELYREALIEAAAEGDDDLTWNIWKGKSLQLMK